MSDEQDHAEDPKIQFNAGDMVLMIGQLTNAVLHLSSAVREIANENNEAASAKTDAAVASIDPILEVFRSKLEGSVSDGR